MFKVKDDKELKALLKPSRSAVVDADIPNGLELIEKLEKRLAKAEKQIKGMETRINNLNGQVIELRSINHSRKE